MKKLIVILLSVYFVDTYCQEANSSKAFYLKQVEKSLIEEIKIKTDSLKKVQNLISETENFSIIEEIKKKTGGLYLEAVIIKDSKIRSEPNSASEKFVAFVKIGDKVTLIDYEAGLWTVEKDKKIGYLNELYLKVTPEVEALRMEIKKRKKELNEFEIAEKKKQQQVKYEEQLKIEETNKQEQLRKEEAYKQEVLKKYGKEQGNKLLNGYFWIGMTDEMARVSLGEPKQINKSVGSWGIHEQWIYYNLYVYFENGILSSYQKTE